MRGSRAIFAVVLILFTALGLNTAAATAATVSPGDILVVDEDGGVVRHYSATGSDLGLFASGLAAPAWITTDRNGNVYVSEYRGGKVVKFSAAGDVLLTITTPYIPGGVEIGGDGSIYVAHYDAGTIHRYSPAGSDLGIFATYAGCATGCGTDFIKFDSAGNLYVGDFQPSGRIRVISPAGVDLGNFVTADGVEGMAFDATGNLYVSNYITGVIHKYSPSGADLGAFAPVGSGFYGLAFDGEGNLYSSLTSPGIVKKFSSSGADLGGFGVSGRDLVVVQPGGPATKDECKEDGWKSFEFPRAFEDQGDCIQFVNTGK